MAHKIQVQEGIQFCMNCGAKEFTRQCEFSSDVIEREKISIEKEKASTEKEKANNGLSQLVTYNISTGI
jgi:hypothetical protein